MFLWIQTIQALPCTSWLFDNLLIGFTIIYYFITPNLIIACSVSAGLGVAGAIGITYLPALGVFMLGCYFGFIISLVLIAFVRIDYMQQDDVRDVIMLALSVGMGFASLRWKKATVMGGSSVLGAFSVANGVDHWGNTGFSKMLTDVLDYQTSNINFSGVLIGVIVAFFVMSAVGFLVQFFITGVVEEHDLSVSGQLPITIPRLTCCNPYVTLFRKKRIVYKDEVPLLDVVTLND